MSPPHIFLYLVVIVSAANEVIYAIGSRKLGLRSRSQVRTFYRRRVILKLYKLSLSEKEVLKLYSPYYNNLPDAFLKRRFERKVARFLRKKKFISRVRAGYVSKTQKLHIAACAVEITFGLPEIYLQHFDKVILYDSDYYSTITRKYHKGEVNVRGVIVLSWQHFKEGYELPDNGHNLGLHEMAHALLLENKVTNDEFDYLSPKYLSELVTYIEEVRGNPYHPIRSFFRSYAFTDDFEFFSVAVESFFEKTEEFIAADRVLYSIIREVLNQDPHHGYYGFSDKKK